MLTDVRSKDVGALAEDAYFLDAIGISECG
jgi:hypothetical protein